jgi:hypothetical protein
VRRLNLGMGATPSWDGAAFVPVRITRTDGTTASTSCSPRASSPGANVLLQTTSTGGSAS